MINKLPLLAFILFISWSCAEKPLIKNVNPFIGTDFHGHTYPGATTPFGGVQLSPDTRRGNWDACSGYHYSDSTIIGFSHTHLSGTGCIDLGDVLFHPTTGEINLGGDGYIFKPLNFSHKNEYAEPGYYRVKTDKDILVELTATSRAGIHRYHFPEKEGKIVIDMAHLLDNEKIHKAELNVSNNSEITGMRSTKGWVDNQQVYFVAQFSQPFDNTDLISSRSLVPDSKSISGDSLQAVAYFSNTNGQPVEVKVGISLVSIHNARLNLESEVADLTFDQIKDRTQQEWEEALSTYTIEGASDAERTTFYTAVYHTMMAPNVISDVNGDYRGADLKVYNSKDRPVYSTFSLWDTYRAWNPLMTITDTPLVNDMINSMLNFYDQTGELPIWSLAPGETGTMIGYHSVSVIWDAYNNNIRDFDAQKALEAMVASAHKNSKGTSPYINLGFIPSDSKKESVSRLLENAYDDWCIAQMAKALGDEAVYKEFAPRASLYKNVFDGDSQFFRPRRMDGSWEPNFNPYEVGRAYTEATAWQYRFAVPHDVNGMINLFGGQDEFIKGLDSLFYTNRKVEGELVDITGLLGQYAHGNEPSHHIAYLYSYVGEAHKTQQLVRRLLNEMYSDQPDGIIGNEDCGQMSAWYIMSSMGFYPVCPGSGQFVLTSPLFPKATVKLANGNQLEITANNPSENIYIEDVLLNGESLGNSFITYNQVMGGGQLQFILGSDEDMVRRTNTAPFSMSTKKEVSIPYVSSEISFFENKVDIVCGSATPGAEIRYTTDGSEPTEASALYTEPFGVDKTTDIRLRAFKTGYEASSISNYTATKAVPQDAKKVHLHKNGVAYAYYEGHFSETADMFKTGRLKKTGICPEPTLSIAEIPDHFGIAFSGYIKVPHDGVYSFATTSDDGSVLFINDQLVVDNDMSHGAITATGQVALKKGFHAYKLLYFEDYEGQSLTWSWILPGNKAYERISPEVLFIK
ncbi:alpha-1,2-mannosidase, putative [Saccharicrinis carchari]|uniref:Alpha-1,2-mannosidase, putative n=1 Tax=Saccharicrinis carchari TaxID=1168039 RepID=A0A521B5G1_SACCC|nr:GH92 family glycosyl hydrolase [Saccharicrinis carchari]SMO42281.1 alpha-1,2-mannosidase, putative [Saccharicrinis carchari]